MIPWLRISLSYTSVSSGEPGGHPELLSQALGVVRRLDVLVATQMKRLKLAVIVIVLAVFAWAGTANAYIRYNPQRDFELGLASSTLVAENQALKERLAALETRIGDLEARISAGETIVRTFQEQIIGIQKVVITLFSKFLK